MRWRKSYRASKHDYSEPGHYFVTSNIKGDKTYFGEIENGVMQLNDYGIIADRCWRNIP